MATRTVNFQTFASVARTSSAAWANPGNAALSDDSRATVSLAGGQVSDYLKCTNRDGAAFVAGDTINGITLYFEAKYGVVTTTRDDAIRMVDDTGAIGATDKSDATAWPASDTVLSRGGSSDKWGYTSSQLLTMLNVADWGFAISCIRPAGAAPQAAGQIDHVYAVIDYTPAPAGITGNFMPMFFGM